MSTGLKESYGPRFDLLSLPGQRAVEKYIDAMSRIYPQLAEAATAAPGREDAIYVYVPVATDEDEEIEIHEAMAKIGTEILLDTGVAILLMPAPEDE